MRDAVTCRGPKCFMVSENVSSSVINSLVVARRAAVSWAAAVGFSRCAEKMRTWTAAIMGAACQRPLDTWVLINALSHGVAAT